MLGEVLSSLHRALSFRWKLAQWWTSRLEFLLGIAVMVANESLHLRVAHDNEAPILPIAATRSMDARVHNFLQNIFGDRVGFKSSDGAQRVDGLKQSRVG